MTTTKSCVTLVKLFTECYNQRHSTPILINGYAFWRRGSWKYQNQCKRYFSSQEKLVQECKKCLSNQFKDADIFEPEASAAFIIAHVMGRKTLANVPDESPVSNSQWTEIQKLARLRLKRMPVQYVIGNWDFCDLTLDVRPPVLIPRPETEELVELVRQDPGFRHAQTFLEVGPGSGAICLALLKSNPRLQGIAVDIDSAACELTLHNAKKLGLSDRLQILNKDISQIHDLKVDFIVSNPPYINTKEMEDLQPEIKGFESSVALHGGSDGLDVVRKILHVVPSLLTNNGSLWLEIDRKHPEILQTMDIPSMFYQATYKDFCGIPRFCHLKKMG